RSCLVGALVSARLRRSDGRARALSSSGAEGEPHGRDSGCAGVDGALDGSAHRIVAALFEQRIELLDATARQLRLAVGDVGEQRQRRRPEVEQLLALLVELGALAVDGGHLRGAMLGQRRGWLVLGAAAMRAL